MYVICAIMFFYIFLADDDYYNVKYFNLSLYE